MKPPTQAELDEYRRLNDERLELASRVRTIDKRCKTLKAGFSAWLKNKGGKTARRLGYVLAFVAGRKSIRWKDLLIDEIGADKVAELEAAAKAPDVITITKA